MLPARDSPSSSPLGPRSRLCQATRPRVSSHSHAIRIPLSPSSFLVVRKRAYPHPLVGALRSSPHFFQLPAPLSPDSRASRRSGLYFFPVYPSGHHCPNFYPDTPVLPLLELRISRDLQSILSFRFLLLSMVFWRFISVVCVRGS